MQERVTLTEGETAEPSWYLTRDGQQFGPLSDKELSLFADGGNFKPGDLLWTAGLDNWKPADSIFGLKPSPEPKPEEQVSEDAPVFAAPEPEADAEFTYDSEGESADADEVFKLPPEPVDAHPISHHEDVEALVHALNGNTTHKPTLKERAITELKKFVAIFVYLWAVFIVLLLHEWVVLSQNHIGFKFYGIAAINALIFSKILLIAEHFKFAERLNTRPLVYPIVYKTVAFTTLLFVAYIIEGMVVGWFRGDGFFASMPHIGGGLIGALSLWLIFSIALAPFFAFREIRRVLGPEKFRTMLLGRRRAASQAA